MTGADPIMRKHFHNDDDQHDALNDYLEAHVGFPPADSRAGQLAPDMRDAVEEFLDLAERAGAIPGTHSQQGTPAMNATLPVSGALPATAPKQSRRRTQPSLTLPAWTRHLHMLSSVLLIAAVAALSFAAFGPNGIGGGGDGTGDGPGQFAAVPIATVPDDAVTSSIPYPTADECTVEPIDYDTDYDSVLSQLRVANAVPRQTMALGNPNHPYSPSDQEAGAIMQAYREVQACWQRGPQYVAQLITGYGQLNVFDLLPRQPNDEPLTEGQLIQIATFWFLNEDPAFLIEENAPREPQPAVASPDGFPETPGTVDHGEMGTPFTSDATAAPVAYGTGDGPVWTIFPEDITMYRPDVAAAQAYFVDPVTREVQIVTPETIWFFNDNGQWKIDRYMEGPLG